MKMADDGYPDLTNPPWDGNWPDYNEIDFFGKIVKPLRISVCSNTFIQVKYILKDGTYSYASSDNYETNIMAQAALKEWLAKATKEIKNNATEEG